MERLDLRLVEYFVAVAEELHFGRAAERLHIAQPSLSQQIRRLENQLGVTLFERTTRQVRITPAGEALLHEGRRTLAQARRAVQATRAAGGERLTVGFYGSAASALLPDALSLFGEQHPSVEVSVRDLMLGSLDELVDGSVDLAFTRLLPGQRELECEDQIRLELEVLTHEPRVVALSVAHPLAGHESLRFADLTEEGFITNPAIEYDGAPPRWLAEQRRHGLSGRVAARAASVQEILTLVASGRGVSLVPASVTRDFPRDGIAYVPVIDADAAVVSLAWRAESLRPVVVAFIETARRVAAGAQTVS
jgi:DNA-binding transcriptional LysR family regulator